MKNVLDSTEIVSGKIEIVQGVFVEWLLMELTNDSRCNVQMFVNRINKY